MPILVGSTGGVVSSGPGVPGMLLHDGQVALGDVTLGATDEYGVEWFLEALVGWFDSPGSTGATEQRASDHGGWLSPAFYTPRVIGIEGTLLAGSWANASLALDRLMGAVPLTVPATMYVAESDDRTLQADVRQEGDPLVTRLDGWARFSLSLLAPDPRRYSTELTTAQTGLPVTTGGLSLPLTLPLTVGATVASGVLTVTNAGNMSARPTFTVYGPSPAFSITHLGTGKTLRFADPIAAGRTLTIDTDKRRALLDGTASRVVTGTWFDYAPGVNQVAFASATYDPAALLVSQSRSAWR